MAVTDVAIASNALVKLGANPISSFDDDSTEAQIANALYEDAIRDLLTQHDWRFAQNLKALNTVADTPAGRWDYAYQLPSGYLTLHGCFRDDNAIVYDLYGSQVWTNEDDNVLAEYTFRPDIETWPQHFITAAQFWLAAEFAMPVTEKRTIRDGWLADALDKIASAKRIDGRQRTSQRARANRLVAAQRG